MTISNPTLAGAFLFLVFLCIPTSGFSDPPDSLPPLPQLPVQTGPQDLLRTDSLELDSLYSEAETTAKKRNRGVRRNRGVMLNTFGNEHQPQSTTESDWLSDSLPPQLLGGGCCDNTRLNYHELITNPPDATSCIITDPDTGGLFYRTTSGESNGGTIIQDQTGFYWHRIFEPGYYKLSWWPEGTPINANDTIDSASEAFQLIFELSGAGTTIDLASVNSPVVYNMDRPVPLQPFSTIIGQGDTLRRIDTPLGVVASPTSAGDSWIPLVDASDFLEQQAVMITRGRSHDDVLVPQKKITEIDGNSIKIQGTLNFGLLAGDTVIVAFNMFNNASSFDLGDILFEGVIFDGNWRNNPYTNSWSQNNSISILNNVGSRLYVDRCGAFDTPSENFIGATCRITNSHFKRLAGSIYHVSIVPDTTMNVYIENCWADSLCLATSAVTSHSEAAIVTSALPGNITLHNCDFSNGAEAIVGDLGGGSDFVSISNSKFRNFKWVVFGGTGDVNQGGEIKSSYFENCGQLEWSNGQNLAAKYAIDWTIQHNEFVNTVININGMINCQITGNTMRYDPDLGGFQYLVPENQLEFPAMVHLASFRTLVFEGNTLTGPFEYMKGLQHGLLFSTQGNIPDNDQFIYERNAYIRNNTIQGFHKSISTINTLVPYNGSLDSVMEYYNWVIANNDIAMVIGTTPNSWGIYAAPGVQVMNNRIVTAQDTISGATYPIIGMAVPSSPGNPKEDEIMGAVIVGNTITGIRNYAGDNYAIYIGAPFVDTDFTYLANAICINNVINAPVAPLPGTAAYNKCHVANNLVIFPKRKPIVRDFPPDY